MIIKRKEIQRESALTLFWVSKLNCSSLFRRNLCRNQKRLLRNCQEKKQGKSPQEPILQQIPMNLNPTATAQATKNSLPVYILPLPAAQPISKAPTKKSNPSLPMLKNFKRLVAIVQNFATTSKKMAAAHIAWHSGWFGCWFGFGASEPRHF